MRRTNVSRYTLVAVLALGACVGPGMISPESPLGKGRAHLEAAQFAEARDAFREWLAEYPEDVRARIGLGAAFEELGHLDSARALYIALSEEELPRRMRGVVDGRLRLLARRENELAARQAIADEARLSRLPPNPNTIAVFPFLYLGSDAQYRPLGNGLAQVFVSDLAQVPGLTLLERGRIRALLDEMQLADSGRVDPATGARSGRLLRAARILQGSITGLSEADRVRLDANVVNTTTAEVAASGSDADRLRQLFDLEKTVLFQLIDGLGIALTTLERERLLERPTADLMAFLAFSRGVEAEDRGDFAVAAREYEDAVRIDPGFGWARQRSREAASTAEVTSLSGTASAGLVDLAVVPSGDIGFASGNLDAVMQTGTMAVGPEEPPQGRDPLADVGGGDEITPPGEAPIVIMVPRPRLAPNPRRP